MQKYLAFLKVADTGSFTKAASELRYTQSNISQIVSHLEDEWQVTLLNRRKAGITLTSEGISLLPYIRKLCECYRELQTHADNVRGIQSGLIRIATFPSIAGTWLPRVIKAFLHEFPLVDFEVLMGDYNEITRMIQNDKIDCAVMSSPFMNETAIDSTFIQNDNYIVLLSEEDPLTKYDKIPLSLIASKPMIMLEKDGLTEEISAFFKQYGLAPNVRFRAWDNNAIMCMVENGLGISILSELMIERSPYNVVSKELEVPAYRRICYCVKDFSRASPSVRKLLEYIQNCRYEIRECTAKANNADID